MSGVPLPRQQPPEQADVLETASYIADMTRGMSVLARQRQLDVLVYLLQVVRLEAEEVIHRIKKDQPG